MNKNSQTPLVSINITTYNRGKLIGRCLESIFLQSYQNLEINIVDDFSTDNTSTIVKEYQQKDSRIKYYKHSRNKGNAFSRNTALKNTNGKYVAFMDDDDEWIDVDKLKKQVEVLENDNNENIAIVCSSIKIISEHGSYDKIILKPENLEARILSGNSLIYNSTVLARTSVMNEIGGFDEKLPRGIDSDFFRTVIVFNKNDVYFLKDITTSVHEYGDDRMTNLKSVVSMKKDILSNEICLRKFKNVFKEYNDIKRLRTKRLIKKYIKLIYLEPSLENISRMFKAVRL